METFSFDDNLAKMSFIQSKDIIIVPRIIEYTTEIVEQQGQENMFETIRKNSMELREKYPHLNSLEALLQKAQESEEE